MTDDLPLHRLGRIPTPDPDEVFLELHFVSQHVAVPDRRDRFYRIAQAEGGKAMAERQVLYVMKRIAGQAECAGIEKETEERRREGRR